MFDRCALAADGVASMSGAPPNREASPLAGRQILIVEDEMILALDLSDMVGAFGCTSAMAARIEKALALIEAHTFDAAILDMNLGGEQVYPVADQLDRRGIPYVIATGYGAEGVFVAYRNHPILAKPYSRRDVEAALIEVLTYRR